MEMFEGKRVLVVERFDRFWTKDGRLLRVPQEDMCQALGVPWTTKYETDGGPGVLKIADLLAASDEPTIDRLRFLKANLVFWLLGATDGHAKNFSVFLSPGGGFQLTPLYDVISAQPSFDTKHVRHKDFRLAMAVGKSRHYQILEVHGRHFVETGELAGLGRQNTANLIDQIIEASPEAIDRAVTQLPKDFPDQIAASIIDGVKVRVAQLQRERGKAFA